MSKIYQLVKKSADLVLLVCIFFLNLTQAYGSNLRTTEAGQDDYSASQRTQKISLAIVGYNYTNRSIDDFSVNGIGGGNIGVSSDSSGGGGDVCCISYVNGTRARVINVRWQVSACRRLVKIPGKNKVYGKVEYTYKEQAVQIDRSIPSNPAYLEVHFYSDGDVQAAITAEESAPRLVLNSNRADRSDYPICTEQ